MRTPSMRPHKRRSGRLATGVTVFLAAAKTVSLAACATQQPAVQASVEPSQQEMDRVSIDISDDWKGALSISGEQLELIFHVEAADDGSISATFDVPAQGAAELELILERRGGNPRRNTYATKCR